MKRFIEQLDIQNPHLRRAVRRVPRHKFVPPDACACAYINVPLPIGFGQTISQPQLVMRMIELLDPQPGDKVLEIGTGSGYQTALLAELGGLDIYSIEIVPELASQAAAHLGELGYSHVHLKQGDGYHGWIENAPYQAIIATAAPDHLPSALVDQLADGGRLVIPLGPAHGVQHLWKLVKQGQACLAYEEGAVAFVPFTRSSVATR